MIDLTILHEKTWNKRFTDADVVLEYLRQVGAAESIQQIEWIDGVIRTDRPELMVLIEGALGNRHKLQCRCAHHQTEPGTPNGQHLPEIRRLEAMITDLPSPEAATEGE